MDELIEARKAKSDDAPSRQEFSATMDVWTLAEERVKVLTKRKVEHKAQKMLVPLPSDQSRKYSKFWEEWYFTDDGLQIALERIREAEAHSWAGVGWKFNLVGLIATLIIATAALIAALQ